MRFIEVYSPSKCAHGKKLVGDFKLISKTVSSGNSQLLGFILKGLRLDENGFLVICLAQPLHYPLTSHCDAFVGVGSVVDNDGTHSIALRLGNKVVDVYGGSFAALSNVCVSTSGSGWYSGTTWHCFSGGRVVRRKSASFPSADFKMEYWVVSVPISVSWCDPGIWIDPYCYVCDIAPTPVVVIPPAPIHIPPPPVPTPVIVPPPVYIPPPAPTPCIGCPVPAPTPVIVPPPIYIPPPVPTPVIVPPPVYVPPPAPTYIPPPYPCSGFHCGNTCNGKACGKGPKDISKKTRGKRA